MQVSDVEWSKAEKKIAQEAFDRAYQREIKALIEEVRRSAIAIAAVDEVWRLHDFLSAKRHEVEGKYDDRCSGLIFAFARLVKEGWLHLDELEGLEPDKLTKVSVLTRM